MASREKTLHANPGRHVEVPAFELESSQRFFARHLVEGGPPGSRGKPAGGAGQVLPCSAS